MKLDKVLSMLRDIDNDMTLAKAQVFLAAALGSPEGLPQEDIEKKVDLGQSSVSRNADRDRNGNEGAGLLERREDFHNRRKMVIKLTHKGKRLAEQLKATLE
jgi:DNA-binding MarR family transcriptional regulator